MQISFELEMVQMPNFLRVVTKPGLRQDGIKETQGVSISDLTESEAREYAEEMRLAFINHWKNKKAAK